MYFISEFWCQE